VFTVALVAVNKTGGSASGTLSITIDNVPPTVSEIQGPSSLDEGTAGTWSVTASDPGGQPVIYAWDFGDGTTSAVSSPTHLYKADGIYTITLTVSDDEGSTEVRTLQVTIANKPP